MKTSNLEQQFYQKFNIPIDYPLQISNAKYLSLIALMNNYKSVKELRQVTLKRCISYGDALQDEIKRIFCVK